MRHKRSSCKSSSSGKTNKNQRKRTPKPHIIVKKSQGLNFYIITSMQRMLVYVHQCRKITKEVKGMKSLSEDCRKRINNSKRNYLTKHSNFESEKKTLSINMLSITRILYNSSKRHSWRGSSSTVKSSLL